jgi:hypothetical protein
MTTTSKPIWTIANRLTQLAQPSGIIKETKKTNIYRRIHRYNIADFA